MEIKDLLKLYHSHKNRCCRCGCELSDENNELGSTFILDFDGNFYCTNCDSDFEEGDERIFEAEFYEDSMQISLNFSKEDIEYIKTKFDVEDEYDLATAVWEMINTYMEL